MSILNKFKRNLRPIFYALSLTLGIYIALQEIHENKDYYRFILFSFLIFFIYLAELYSNWKSNKTKIELNMDFGDEVNELSQTFHKILMPVGLYLSIVGFGFYNIRSSSLVIVLSLVFVTFFILFLNIRAFFEAKTKIEDKTHYVYDLIKFIIFFCLVNVFSNASNNFPVNLSLYAVCVVAITLVLLMLMLWRLEKLHLYSILYGAIVSLFIGIVFLLYHADRVVNSLQISLGLFFVFYLTSAVIHHILMKTFTKGVFFEYWLIITIVIGVTYGIA